MGMAAWPSPNLRTRDWRVIVPITISAGKLEVHMTDTTTIKKTDAEWRAELTPEQFRVLRQHGTERPFSSPLNDEHRDGVFACASCGQELFPSGTKFDSGTGWPSFFAPISKDAVGETSDRSLFMTRTE